MKIALASDHAGYDLKAAVSRYLDERKTPFQDFGSGPGETVDYSDLAEAAVRSVLAGASDRAILFCGTGIGMAMVANKFPGIRAAVCWNNATAELARRHNDSNCLSLGGRVLSAEEGVSIVRVWLDTPFDGGRHRRRLDKIAALEARLCGGRS
ncbi:MAG: ribose 5-phosphate isomerase B [Candidatus Aminicenantes bacterium]|nr:ribose 5-phosphate isomerase B [Candidatus Aminicenantes bacterium]